MSARTKVSPRAGVLHEVWMLLVGDPLAVRRWKREFKRATRAGDDDMLAAMRLQVAHERRALDMNKGLPLDEILRITRPPTTPGVPMTAKTAPDKRTDRMDAVRAFVLWFCITDFASLVFTRIGLYDHDISSNERFFGSLLAAAVIVLLFGERTKSWSR